MTDIAAAAGTSSGLVLYHFGSLAGALAESLTLLEDSFYGDLEAELDAEAGPVERLRRMAELGSGSGPAVGDWTLWLEIWVRALRDETARSARESLDRRWRSALRDVVRDGVAAGVFRPVHPDDTALRLASLMDGLAIQLALEDPGMTIDRFRQLWLGGAAVELGVPPESLGAGRRRGGGQGVGQDGKQVGDRGVERAGGARAAVRVRRPILNGWSGSARRC